jgi:hypothetical protein
LYKWVPAPVQQNAEDDRMVLTNISNENMDANKVSKQLFDENFIDMNYQNEKSKENNSEPIESTKPYILIIANLAANVH